jgi:hypothetical protein
VEDAETSIELLQNVDWIIIPNLNPVSRMLEWSTSFEYRQFSGWLRPCLQPQSAVETKQKSNQFNLHRCRLEQKLGLHVETLGRQHSKNKRSKIFFVGSFNAINSNSVEDQRTAGNNRFQRLKFPQWITSWRGTVPK